MPARISNVGLDAINRQLGLLDTRLTEALEGFEALRRGDLAFSGNIDLGGFRVTNTSDAESDADALTLGELLERLDDLEDEAAQLETSAAEDYAGGGRQKRLLRRTSRLKDQISDEVASIVSALGFPAVVFTQDDGAGNAELATDTTNFVWDDANNRLGIGIAAPLERLHVVGNEILTGILYGGTAAGDHMDIDPSNSANYTGRVRVGTTASNYGTTNAVALEVWPNGLTHSTAGNTNGVLFDGGLIFTGDASGSTADLFRDEHSVGGASAAVTAYGSTRSFFSTPDMQNPFAVAASGHNYVGYTAAPLWSNLGGGTLAVPAARSFHSAPLTISAGITVTEYFHFLASDIPVAGTLTTHIGYDCNIGSGTVPVSFRSTGASTTMRHAGSARFGNTGTPTATMHVQHATLDIVRATDGTNNLFEVLQLETVVNNAGLATHDFRVETDSLTHAVFVDASTNRVGIGDSTPDNHFTVGTTSQFQVGTDGDLDQIKSVPYSWPAANAAGALNNDGAGNLSWAAPAPAAHNLLSASHGDTVTNTVTRGSLVYGNVTPAWDELVIGAANRVLRSDGTDVSWAQVALTTDVTGTLPVGNGGTGNTAFTAGSVIFSNGTILTQDNANFFWDDTSNRLGIGTATPSQELHVVGDAIVTGIVYGGTAAGDNLDLDPSSAANYTGSIRINTTATDYGAVAVTGLTQWPNGFTHGGSVGVVISGSAMTSTVTIDANEALSTLNMFDFQPTISVNAGVTGILGAIGFNCSPTFANAHAGLAVTGAIIQGYVFAPIWSNTGGGGSTITANVVRGFRSVPAAIPAGVTITTLRHFHAEAVAVVGTVTTMCAFDTDIATGSTCLSLRSTNSAAQMRHAGAAVFGANAAVTAATTLEVAASATSSLRNSTRTIFPPTANQVIDAATDTILANATFVNLTNTTGASITLTSAPTIADGEDGMYLIIMNIAADNIVVQDQGTLAGSNLRLGAATRTLGTRDSLVLIYSADIGDWVEVSFNNVV